MSRAQTESTAPAPARGPADHAAGAIAVIMGLLMAAALGAQVIALNAPGVIGSSLDVDFSVFWAAGRLGLAGDWATAYDMETLYAVRDMPPGGLPPPNWNTWAYPPPYHVLMAPFGALPFSAGMIAFNAASLALAAWALHGPRQGVAWGTVLVLASPACLLVVMLGHNTLLALAALVGGIEALRQRREGLAGLLFALLVMKPQLGLLVPVILIAGGHWRALLVAPAGAVVICAASAGIVGLGTWRTYLATAEEIGAQFGAGLFPEQLFITWYRLLQVLGLPRPDALWMQGVIGVAIAAALFYVWRIRAAFDLKAAAVLAGVTLATPYAHHYELLIPCGALLYAARAGIVRGAVLVLAGAVWLLPLANHFLDERGYSAIPVTLVFLAVVVAGVRSRPVP